MKQEDSGPDYFASMTDMMVGILFIFVIMIAYFAFQINSSDTVPKPVHQDVVDENTELKKQLESLKLPNPLETYITAGNIIRDDLVRKVIQQLKANDVDAKSVQRGVVTISGKGLFASGQSDLQSVPGAVEKVNAIATVLATQAHCFTTSESEPKRNKGCNPDAVFIEALFIEGHTDNIPVSAMLADGSKSNLELSSRRATKTYQQAVAFKPDLISFRNPSNQQALSVAAYGEQRPISSNAKAQGREDNRRIDIRFVMHVPKSQSDLRELQQTYAVAAE